MNEQKITFAQGKKRIKGRLNRMKSDMRPCTAFTDSVIRLKKRKKEFSNPVNTPNDPKFYVHKNLMEFIKDE